MLKFYSRKLYITLASLFVAAALFLGVASPAFAKAEDPIRDLSNLNRLQTKAITAAFKHDVNYANSLARQIAGASRKNGLNPKLVQAQGFLYIAQTFLDSHEGFDAEGNVLTRNVAIATLTSVEYNLRNANYWVTRNRIGR
jgi:hypothetical protein